MTTPTPKFNQLLTQCWHTFLSLLPTDIDEQIIGSSDPADLFYNLHLIAVLEQAIDTHFAEEKIATNATILRLTLENPLYLVTQPEATWCVRERDTTASHVLYHVIYEDLKANLELEWNDYIRLVRRCGKQ